MQFLSSLATHACNVRINIFETSNFLNKIENPNPITTIISPKTKFYPVSYIFYCFCKADNNLWQRCPQFVNFLIFFTMHCMLYVDCMRHAILNFFTSTVRPAVVFVSQCQVVVRKKLSVTMGQELILKL